MLSCQKSLLLALKLGLPSTSCYQEFDGAWRHPNIAISASMRCMIIAAIAIAGLSFEAHAQSCAEYRPGPQRFQCASRTHPGLVAKQARCHEEGRKMGLSPRGGTGGAGGGLKEYVMACMQRY
jgi:hypothetical protein